MASEVKEEQNSKPDVSEEENAADNVQEEGVSSAKDIKDNVKKESKEDGKKEESEDDEEDEDEEEEVGLLDRPVEVTGCRARKRVQRLEITFTIPKEKQEFVEGKGKKLGECPRIEMQIQKIKPVELKPLHKILFNRTGSANEIKKNIRKFSGFSFEKDSTEYIRKKAVLEKMTQAILKQICLALDLERGGSKEDIVNRIMSFLLMPEDSGKKVPSKKKPAKEKKKSTGKAEKKGKSEKKVKSSEKVVSVKKDSDDEEQDNMDEDDSTGGEASMGGTDEEAELKTKPKGKKKTKAKAEKQKNEEKPKAVKRKIDEDSSDESADEQPEAKKANKMPTDEDITKLVRQILEAADLQEITMKKVIKQVSDAYPDFDLTHKKPFIKSTIKAIIKLL